MPQQRGTAFGLEFAVELDFVDEVAYDAERTGALIRVRAQGGGRAANADVFAEIIVMDCSLSMASHGKITAAKRAACAAIDALDDGVYLAVIAGNHGSRVLFPANGRLARVDAGVRAKARGRVLGLMPDGGTAIGRWLTAAGDLFEAAAPSGAVCHVALYTDGHDEHETEQELRAALDRCADRFVCDARGLGDDWDFAPLLSIAEALHGDARAVVEVSDLAADFVQLTRSARRLVVPRAYLGLGLDARFRLDYIRQLLPVEADLTQQRQVAGKDPRDLHIPLGAWAADTRDYRLSLTFDADTLPVGEVIRAARVSLLTEAADGTRTERVAAPFAIKRSEVGAPPPPQADNHTWAENNYFLGEAMRDFATGYLAKQFAEADQQLARALELAELLGDAVRLRQLREVADFSGGEVHARRGLRGGLISGIALGSKHTTAMSRGASSLVDGTAREPEVVRVCPSCGQLTYGEDAEVCEACRTPLAGEAP